MRKSVLIVFFLALGASVVLVMWGGAFVTTESAQAVEAQSSSQTGGVSAAKVGRDPVTGALRPTTAQENEALAKAMERALARHPSHSARRDADGTLSLVAAPHFLSSSVARVSGDGTLIVEHVDPRAASNGTAELPKE